MILFDLFALIVLIVFLVRGYNAGLFSNLTSFVALFIALLCALTFWKFFADLLMRIGVTKFPSIISFILIFALTHLIMLYVGSIFRKFVYMTEIGSFLDASLGALFGLLKTIVFVFLFAILVYAQPIFSTKDYKKSICLNTSFMIIEKYKSTFFTKMKNADNLFTKYSVKYKLPKAAPKKKGK